MKTETPPGQIVGGVEGVFGEKKGLKKGMRCQPERRG